MTINVDAAQNRRTIDPRVYGVAYADAATIADLSIPINRWGGNTTSRYNWGNSTSNHARDWFFEGLPDNAPSGGANGESADLFIKPTLDNGGKPIITIPVLGYLPRDRTYAACGYSVAKYGALGCCSATDNPFHSDCGNGLDKVTGNPLKNINNPLDVSTLYTSAYQGSWIQHNIATFGSGGTTGVKYYAIDNEPGLWDSTHFDIHPKPSTYTEIWQKTQDYGSVIKANDPTSLTLGFEEWGWLGYFDSTADWNASPATTSDRDTHGGGVPLGQWLLQQAHAYEQLNGTRLIDIVTVHWYPQGKKGTTLNEYDPSHPAQEVQTATKTLRNQSTRSLWDPTYIEQSWIQDVPAPGEAQAIARLIPRMREWANKYYPGTKIGITEYSWGDGNNGAGVGAQVDPNGATAQADVLGIFGREGLDLATRWSSPPAGTNVYNAIKMYRNYDGAHSKFGDVSVSGSSPVPDTVATFAALRSSDRALTIMVINKDLANTQQVTINLANYTRSGNVQGYQLQANNTIASLSISATPIVLSAPPETITILVVPGGYLDAPGGVSATASSTSNVNVSWNAVANATQYQLYRYANLADPGTLVCTVSTTSCPDGGRSADTTYLYRVFASNGTLSSGPSAFDAATTTMFTDDPLTAGTIAKAIHITELRTAVNAMRTAAGLGAAAVTDPTLTGVNIKAVHVLELRSALDQARAAIGLPMLTYTDAGIPPNAVTIRTAHVADLRTGVR